MVNNITNKPPQAWLHLFYQLDRSIIHKLTGQIKMLKDALPRLNHIAATKTFSPSIILISAFNSMPIHRQYRAAIGLMLRS